MVIWLSAGALAMGSASIEPVHFQPPYSAAGIQLSEE